jgi:antitoxin (DNA-binding transcriptional repressor) of toxin-antitoxin stability system
VGDPAAPGPRLGLADNMLLASAGASVQPEAHVHDQSTRVEEKSSNPKSGVSPPDARSTFSICTTKSSMYAIASFVNMRPTLARKSFTASTICLIRPLTRATEPTESRRSSAAFPATITALMRLDSASHRSVWLIDYRLSVFEACQSGRSGRIEMRRQERVFSRPMKIITKAKNDLSALIDDLKVGSSVLIVDGGRPIARLEPVTGSAHTPQTATLAVNSIPSAFITAIVVFNVGLPCSLSDR